ncbi:MAG: hypothetical protein JWQ01_1795 [Massilia sp.]|jgi:hypothetical protein|nr:hypothetical protein [Massilia sp.]
MDKLVRQLAHDLAAAAAAGDWQAVAAADTAIAAVLAAPQSAADTPALLALRVAHAVALQQCTVAAAAAAAQLTVMQAGRDGWIAYALGSNSNLDGTPA